MDNVSIFKKYYTNEPFIDRYAKDKEGAVDVIIPVIHSTEIWEENLKSIYREIPVNRLLISDGGCKDNSIDIVKKFPRVFILDHKKFVTLGFCLRKLIEAVETEWFIYLHSDVYLPKDWFNVMKKYQPQYDWFGCPQRITAMVEYHNVDKIYDELRPYAGSQMGRREAFIKGLEKIDDDFVYRQEDLIFASLVENNGFKHGRIEDTFHYHQLMHKESPWSRKLTRVIVEAEWSRQERIRSSMMQLKGIVKYLTPTKSLNKVLRLEIINLISLDEFNGEEFKCWVEKTNPSWLPYVDHKKIHFSILLRKIYHKCKELFWGLVRMSK